MMFSLSRITKQWRERQDSHKTGDVAAYSPAESVDPALLNDRSYQDALLDRSVRLFMQEEYGKLQPPVGVFSRVLRAVEAALQSQRQPKLQRPHLAAQLASAFYRAANGRTITRLAPGGIAIAVALAIGLGPDASQLLRDNQREKSSTLTAVPSSTLSTSEQVQKIMHSKQAAYQGSLYYQEIYDPYTASKPVPKPDAATPTTVEPESETKYDPSKLLPQ